MSILDRYLAYAADFEESYEDDNWSRIAQYFSDDAVYAGDPEARGNAAVLDKLKNAVDDFDHRMDSRTLAFKEPQVDGDTVRVEWEVTYTKSDCPDLRISGLETAVFDGDRIALLRDDIAPEAEAAMGAWMTEHGSFLNSG